MSILPGENSGASPKPPFPDPFVVCDGAVGRYLLQMDPTGETFGTLRFMEQVETWVLQRLEVDDASRGDVEARLARLAEIISQYRESIPPENDAFLKVLSWLNTSVTVYVVDYLSTFQQDFFMQLVDYARSNEELNVDAALMLKRVRALWRARLLQRIYSKENVDFVMQVLFREATL